MTYFPNMALFLVIFVITSIKSSLYLKKFLQYQFLFKLKECISELSDWRYYRPEILEDTRCIFSDSTVQLEKVPGSLTNMGKISLCIGFLTKIYNINQLTELVETFDGLRLMGVLHRLASLDKASQLIIPDQNEFGNSISAFKAKHGVDCSLPASVRNTYGPRRVLIESS